MILNQRAYDAIGHVRDIRGREFLELGAIKTHQPALGAYPQKTVGSLGEAGNDIVGQSVVGLRDAGEPILAASKNWTRRQGKQTGDQQNRSAENQSSGHRS